MKLTTITIQGNIFTSEILERIRQNDIRFQNPKDFNLRPRESLKDEISNTWSLLNTHWNIFKKKREYFTEADTGTTETRNNWIMPFLSALGYEVIRSNAETVNQKSYAISHRAANKDGFPIHIVGSEQFLEKRAKHGVRLSPHALVQEYINSTEHIYGLTTNGLRLRLLRDATKLTRLSYVEFDLEKMFEEGHYAEFAILYRLLHATRLPDEKENGADSILEFYHDEALASGSRIRDRLSDAFYQSMIDLGTSLLQDPQNQSLRDQIYAKKITAKSYYSEILRLVYRILFLTVIEERGLIFPSAITPDEQRHKSIYEDYYSIRRLIRLADRKHFIDSKKYDLWQSILMTFLLFEDQRYGKKLNIQPLGFGLFAPNALPILKNLKLKNDVVLNIIEQFNYFENDQGQRVQVNYADLNVEELGSVYEGLLSLEPQFEITDSSQIYFNFREGMSRKETASFYTHHDLVLELINTNLVPLIHQRIAENSDDKEAMKQAILNIKVCDPSVGSGHMLLEAARTLAYHYVRIDSDEEPTPEKYRAALRLVIQNCIYGVDLNPEAVELCKLALWLEGHNSGAPLSFLDHKIRTGNSLIGIHDPKVLTEGIPSKAYAGTTPEEKKSARSLRKKNNDFTKKGQWGLNFETQQKEHYQNIEQQYRLRLSGKQESLASVYAFKKRYEEIRKDPHWYQQWMLSNLWCAPFFADYSPDYLHLIPTSEDLKKYQSNPGALHGQMAGYATQLAMEHQYFHWHLEFPEVFSKGGFDLMIGNPPWEKIKLQEKEFFKNKNKNIANAPNASKRKKRIKKLKQSDPTLFAEYEQALHYSNHFSLFIRQSNFFPLTAKGDINLYSIFAEHFYKSINDDGRAGIICPTGIATDNNTKDFFAEVVLQDRLISFYDFENRKKLFPIHRSFKFCLMSLGYKSKADKIKFAFFLHHVTDIQDENRVFELSIQNFVNINPNTKTAPVFRTQKDADLTAKIYNRLPVIWNEELNQNLWELNFIRQFDMTNDSHLFTTEYQENQSLLPLYEAKYIWHYDHRLNTYEGSHSRTSYQLVNPEDHQDPAYRIQPWYWIEKSEVENKTDDLYFIGFRNNARNTDARTGIFSLVPFSGVGNSMPLIFIKQISNRLLFLSHGNSLIFDFFVRQKIGGTNLNFLYVYQFPSLSPKTFTSQDKSYILPRVVELTYTSWDIKNASDDLWKEADQELRQLIKNQHQENALSSGGAHPWDIPKWAAEHPWIEWEKDKGIPLPPFRWNEDRRMQLTAELDAYYALLFGLERDEVAYILDPKEVMGEDFPGESFRVLKEKEIREFGEFRTKKRILKAYDRLRLSWDMPSHLHKLRELWEYHQQDLSENSKKKKSKGKSEPKNYPTKTKPASAVKEDEADYHPTELFEEPNLFNQGSKED